MKNIIKISGAVASPEEWVPALFDGRIVVFSGLSELDDLFAHGRAFCRSAYESDRPDLHADLSDSPGFGALADKLDRDFNKATETTMLFRAFFQAVGLNPKQLYYDQWRLRSNPSHKAFLSDKTRHVPPHRDNWGSHLHQQLNWWGPLYDIDAQRTLLFYPRYWQDPVDNNSRDWSLEELLHHRKSGDGVNYPTLPTVTTEPDDREAMPLLLQPGELACFSGAHLHGSARNRSGFCRFNLETRTVSLDDIARGHHAPNIDGPDDRLPAADWFRNIETGARLTVEQLAVAA